MKNRVLNSTIALCTLATSLALMDAVTEREIDSDYSIRFDTWSADGTFSDLSGTIVWDENDLSNSKVEVEVQANTISTGNDLKDEHAVGDDWFEADRFPTISLTSTRFEKQADGFVLNGLLELHGVTKEVVIPFVAEESRGKKVFKGTFVIDRTEFDLGKGFKSLAVGKEVEIEFVVPTSLK